MQNLLEIKDLSVEFRLGQRTCTAVKDVSFSVAEAEVVVLAGESGSGKTVSALSITSLLPENARVVRGSVLLRGVDLLKLTEKQLARVRGREIAYIFQEPVAYLNPVYTIGSQIAEVLTVHQGMGRAGSRKEAERLLCLAGIPDPRRALNAYPHEFSGGMNQRAAIAMALAARPKLLIADEPTTALDVTIEARILELLKNLRQELGFSMLFITHNLAIARRIADRVVVMYRGAVVESGCVEHIFGTPQHEHTKELIAAYEKIGVF